MEYRHIRTFKNVLTQLLDRIKNSLHITTLCKKIPRDNITALRYNLSKFIHNKAKYEKLMYIVLKTLQSVRTILIKAICTYWITTSYYYDIQTCYVCRNRPA